MNQFSSPKFFGKWYEIEGQGCVDALDFLAFGEHGQERIRLLYAHLSVHALTSNGA